MTPFRKEYLDFLIVSEYKNFSQAADKLGVKQSGLSKSIKRLEEELKHKLFMRGARELRLTDAGLILKEELIREGHSWQLAIERIDRLHTDVQGTFELGAHPVLAKYIIPKVLGEVNKEKGVDVNIHLTSSRESVEMVREMKLDLAIAVSPIQYPDLVIKPLWKEYIGLYSKTGEMEEQLYYNPDMINALEYIGKYATHKSKMINDYQIIYSIAKRSSGTMCLLPNPIVDNEGKLKLIRKLSKDINVCLVYRQDRLKTKGFSFINKTIQSVAKK